MLEFLRKAAPIAGILLVFAFGWHLGSSSKDHDWKEVVNNEYIKKDEARKDKQDAIDTISQKYQDDYAALEGSTDGIINALSGDNKRMRANACSPGSARGPSGRCESYVSVELHESTVKSLITITQKADLKEKALQDTIRKLQNKEKH